MHYQSIGGPQTMRRLIQILSEFVVDVGGWLPALGLVLIASGVIITVGRILGGGR